VEVWVLHGVAGTGFLSKGTGFAGFLISLLQITRQTKEANLMIVGERILDVSGNKTTGASIKGLSINIALEDVQSQNGHIEITYVYTANYEENVGQIKIKGTLLAKEEDKFASEIVDMWKKNKKVPDAYAETVLSAVNYSGSANGTLMARVLGLTAPLIPPRIQLSRPAPAAPEKHDKPVAKK
jgi:hypothetical protein